MSEVLIPCKGCTRDCYNFQMYDCKGPNNYIEMANFIKHSGHLYTVENQNGFNNALYDYFDVNTDHRSEEDKNYRKQEIRKMIQIFPNYYPASIVIIDQSFECGRIYIEQIDISEITHALPGWFYNSKS